MRNPEPDQRSSIAVSLQTAMMAWVPIGVGIILGTITRVVVFVAGGTRWSGAVGSVLWIALGAAAAVYWLVSSTDAVQGLDLRMLSATWVLVTILFRAVWIGLVTGGGWEAVMTDYRIRQGQPGLAMLAAVAIAPLLIPWFTRWHGPH